MAGDTEFVQRCAERDSNLKIAVLAGMQIRHQEIQKPTDWLRKLILYGRHNRHLEKNSNYQTLGIKDKYDIVLDLWLGEPKSFCEKLSLLTGLFLGQICYGWGLLFSRGRPC